MKKLILLAAILAITSASAETVKDREGAVRGDKKKMEGNARWIYNDIDAGFKAARESGKPLMVVLRCVPCLACMGLDAGVLLENQGLKPLMDQFVRVRLINANAIDMSRFQFDYDLSFSTLFFNGDGTVYARYGSWEHQHDAQNQATASFRQTLEGVLNLHRGYPRNKVSLAGKQGERSKYKTPVDMPMLHGKYRLELNWEGKVVQSCVHCHQIGDAVRLSYRNQRKAIPPKWIYPYPTLEVLGAELDVVRVKSVQRGSAAATAGLKQGQQITAVNGQPVVSSADVSWALHNAPDDGALKLSAGRSQLTVALKPGWRNQSHIERRVGTWPMRAMASGGMKLEDLSEAERRKRGIAKNKLALFAKRVGRYGKHGAAKRAGFRDNDIIIALAGDTTRLSESEFIGQMITNHKPGAKISTTVLRGNRRLNLKLPIQ
ncbi:MAG: Trx7/PDZ domain-containing (seleno)protein [Limisphaerales bacterium]